MYGYSIRMASGFMGRRPGQDTGTHRMRRARQALGAQRPGPAAPTPATRAAARCRSRCSPRSRPLRRPRMPTLSSLCLRRCCRGPQRWIVARHFV